MQNREKTFFFYVTIIHALFLFLIKMESDGLRFNVKCGRRPFLRTANMLTPYMINANVVGTKNNTAKQIKTVLQWTAFVQIKRDSPCNFINCICRFVIINVFAKKSYSLLKAVVQEHSWEKKMLKQASILKFAMQQSCAFKISFNC